ncbi:MFS transporter [Schleiferilactobacillus perolens]|uniref:MFS transporter n=1 Tax=Schleiferilactobacillus perolens TaxID=100468 RepID=UPI002353E941|nr:MFS transporter [Schleiferilactobacillus perolens]MCI2170599.1 MFS transporter [Schleiferilactobacillus perolens]
MSPANTHRTRISIGLYINYIVHGAGVLILAQSMTMLAGQWHTTTAAVGAVIAAMGIGRLVVLLLSGYLSDRWGRQFFVGLGMTSYLVFFIGILWSPTAAWGFAFSFLAGCANSFLDAGTYPALMDVYPEQAGAANVLIKGAMSAGQFLLPLLVGWTINAHAWFGINYLVLAAILIINAAAFLTPWWRKSPVKQQTKSAGNIKMTAPTTHKKMPWLLFILFICYGFLSQGIFWVFTQNLTQYGIQVLHLAPSVSGSLLSWYSVGSFLCVLVNVFFLSRRFRPHQLLVPFTIGGTVTLLPIILQAPTAVIYLATFLFGFCTAGGVMQLGLTVMTETLPLGRGTATGFYYSAGAISHFILPLITARWSTDVMAVFWFDLSIAVSGIVVTALISALVNRRSSTE